MRHLHQFIELHMRIFWEMHRHFCRVCEAKKGAVGGVLLNTVGVWVHAAARLQVRRPPPTSSVGDSSIEVEVPHVFGRFLRSAHLLIVEDDPPAGEKKGFEKQQHSLTDLHKNDFNHFLMSNRNLHNHLLYVIFTKSPYKYIFCYIPILNCCCSDQWSLAPPAVAFSWVTISLKLKESIKWWNSQWVLMQRVCLLFWELGPY